MVRVPVSRDAGARAEFGGAALDHAPGVDPVHGRGGERAGAAGGRAEEGSLARVANAGRLDIGVEIGFEIVMRRHLMALAAFSRALWRTQGNREMLPDLSAGQPILARLWLRADVQFPYASLR
jgi:hypothetical protein